MAMSFDLSDSKEDLPNADEQDDIDVFLTHDSTFDHAAPGLVEMQHCRLPTGRSETRLAKANFQKIHDSAARIKETFYNLLGALRVSSDQRNFALEWLEKENYLDVFKQRLAGLESGNFLDVFQQMLAGLESMLMLASGGAEHKIPIVSNLQAVRAANKSSGNARKQLRPVDIRTERKKRKRAREDARSNLATVQTPLVAAHRPNKKRVTEASRHQKNYEVSAKRSRVPKVLHPSIKPAIAKDDSPESSR